MKQLTYLILNLIWLLLAWLAARWLRPESKSAQQTRYDLRVVIFLYLAMVVFNTYLTALPIVRYDWQRVLGFKILTWPIEDAAYLVVALYVAPALYRWLLHRHDSKPHSQPPGRSRQPQGPTATPPTRSRRPRTTRDSGRKSSH